MDNDDDTANRYRQTAPTKTGGVPVAWVGLLFWVLVFVLI